MTREAVALLRSRSIAVSKPDPVEKKPTYPGWSVRSLEPDDFAEGDQVGMLGGPLSDGKKPDHALVILDLDSTEANQLADEYLPATAMMEGRQSKPRSHRGYLVPTSTIPAWATSTAAQAAKAAKDKTGHAGPFLKHFTHRETKKGVLDFIGTGGQVVCPPSTHPSGERREWEGGSPGQPAVVDFLELWRAVCELASACGCEIPKVIPQPPRGRGEHIHSEVVDRARRYLAKMEAGVQGCNGSKPTFAAARAMVWGFDLDPEMAYRLLTDEYNPRCSPPWSERELRHKIEDADRVPYGKPRGYLRDTPLRNGHHAPIVWSQPSKSSQKSPQFDANHSDDGSIQGTSGTTLGVGGSPPSPLPTMPPVPPFPLSVFPAAVAEYFRAVAAAMSSPVDHAAVPGLAVLGAAIGRSRAAEVKSGYAESPAFWTAVFAPPGATKSPNLRAVAAPLRLAESSWLDSHRSKLSIHATEADRYGAELKEWKTNKCLGNPPAPPQKPVLRQSILDDVTAEAAAKILLDCPRGLVLVKDELLGFTRSLNAYKGGRGADKEFWLSAWAGAPAKVNRSGNHDAGPLVITHPFIAVAGMLCPDSLPELRGELRNGDAPVDGFLDRFLLSFPDPIDAEPEQWRTVPGSVEQAYHQVFAKLLNLDMVAEAHGTDTRYRPDFIPFSQRGRVAWQEFTEGLAAKMNSLDKFDPFRGVLSKLRGYGLRLACLLWCLRHVTGELAADEPIGAEIMVDAAKLTNYFEKHIERCLGRGWADRTSRLADRVIHWLARDPERKTFTKTEAFQQLKDRRDARSSDALIPTFRLLADHDYIRPVTPEGSRPGPIPDLYAVNPYWVRSTAEVVPEVPTIRPV